MGAIEETRQVIQDFLAPELRAIGVRMTAIEDRLNRIDHRLDKIEEKFEERFEKVDERFNKIDERFERLESKIAQQFADFRAEFLFDKRLSRVEAQLEEQKKSA